MVDHNNVGAVASEVSANCGAVDLGRGHVRLARSMNWRGSPAADLNEVR